MKVYVRHTAPPATYLELCRERGVPPVEFSAPSAFHRQSSDSRRQPCSHRERNDHDHLLCWHSCEGAIIPCLKAKKRRTERRG